MGKIMNPREEEIMNELWKCSNSISTSELMNLLHAKGWNKSTFYNSVQSLFDKEYIKTSGLERVNTQYARLLEPAVTHEEYWAIYLKEKGVGLSSIKNIYHIMAQDGACEENLEEVVVNASWDEQDHGKDGYREWHYMCTNCGKEAIEELTPYCPHCGAKMAGSYPED